MEVPKELKALMTRYLLGEATSVEQEQLEDRYAAEPEVFEQLVAVENELADRYARRELTDKQQQALFVHHVLAHPRRRHRVHVASALVAALDEAAQLERKTTSISLRERIAGWWGAFNSSWGLSLGVTAATVLLIGGSWWFWRWLKVPALSDIVQNAGTSVSPTPERVATATATATATNATPVPSLRPTEQSAEPAVLAFTLAGALVRDVGKIQTLNIPQKTKQVQLRLKLANDDFPQYQIKLSTVAGQNVLEQTRLQPAADRKSVALNVAAKQLAQGDYFLVLSGVGKDNEIEELVTYVFRVERQ